MNESAFTPEKVPTPLAPAHAPELKPVEILTPFPPSIKGRTSAPEIIIGSMDFTLGFLSFFQHY
jgi:hypothetical protein